MDQRSKYDPSMLASLVAVIAVAGQAAPSASLEQRVAVQRLSFEVASIKANHSAAPAQSRFPLGAGDAFVPGGVFAAVNQPLIVYLQFAFKVTDLLGLPSWVYRDRFDIEARAPGTPTKDDMRLMMRSLLTNRFKLVVRTQSLVQPVLHLELAGGKRLGPYLRSAAPCPGATQVPDFPAIDCGKIGPAVAVIPGRVRLVGRDVSLGRIAGALTNPATEIDRPVIDRTGLRGTFDFTLEWLPGIDVAQPTFVQALRDQLGLVLTRSRGAVEVITVEHIEHPTSD